MFFALWPSQELQQQLFAFGLQQERKGGRPVAQHNIHMTLLFLGSITPSFRSCMENVAAQIKAAPFSLYLDQAGYFPRPKVSWVGCSRTPPALTQLVMELRKGQRDCGSTPESRGFVPHMTLARKVGRTPKSGIEPDLDWPVREFCLVRSETLSAGVEYTVVSRWPLCGQG